MNQFYGLLLFRYRGVKIDNFSTSWRNGLGFNALIHAHRPDLINFDKLNPNDHIANLNNAFNVADDKLGISSLLDAEGAFMICKILCFPWISWCCFVDYVYCCWKKFSKNVCSIILCKKKWKVMFCCIFMNLRCK